MELSSGVDVVNRLKEEYSVARVACRWPLRLFFTILNIAGINSQIIYKENTNIIITDQRLLETTSSSTNTAAYPKKKHLPEHCISSTASD